MGRRTIMVDELTWRSERERQRLIDWFRGDGWRVIAERGVRDEAYVEVTLVAS